MTEQRKRPQRRPRSCEDKIFVNLKILRLSGWNVRIRGMKGIGRQNSLKPVMEREEWR